MSRQISQSALQAVLAQETDEIILVALKIDHTTLDSPLLFVNDTQDLVRSDGTYLAFPFEIKFPDDSEDDVPTVNIVIDNVDQRVIEELRAIEGRPEITIEIILRSQPNTPEMGPFTMKLKGADYDTMQIRGEIGYEEDFLNQKFPAGSFNPRTAVGMFS